MTISFNRLPDSLPDGNTIIPEGKYSGTIIKAEMKQSQSDPNKPPYLSLTWRISDNNTVLGNIFDNITESENVYVQHKLKSLLTALDITGLKEFELRDLPKLLINKSCTVSIRVDTKSEPQRSQVNIFDEAPYRAFETSSSKKKAKKLDVEESEPDSENFDEAY